MHATSSFSDPFSLPTPVSDQGDYAVLVQNGFTHQQALLCNLVSSLVCLAGFVVATSLSTADLNTNQWIFAVTAGMFYYMALSNLVRLSNHTASTTSSPPLHSGFRSTDANACQVRQCQYQGPCPGERVPMDRLPCHALRRHLWLQPLTSHNRRLY
jgi:hypothetical protein